MQPSQMLLRRAAQARKPRLEVYFYPRNTLSSVDPIMLIAPTDWHTKLASVPVAGESQSTHPI